MGSGKPPSFAQESYWDKRFKEQTQSYDWLQQPDIFDGAITDAFTAAADRRSLEATTQDDLLDAIQGLSLDAVDDSDGPRILHIGPGTSLLSCHLRSFVRDPRQIQNADFSAEAVDWGRRKEKEMFGFEIETPETLSDIEEEANADDNEDGDHNHQDVDDRHDMRRLDRTIERGRHSSAQLQMPMTIWTQTSLLSLESVVATCKISGYDIIIDKSCCDAIACGTDVEVLVPYFLYLDKGKGKAEGIREDTASFHDPDAGTTETAATTSKETAEELEGFHIHPLHLLAVHLGLVAKPGCRWIALSYSESRFPFLSERRETRSGNYNPSLPQKLLGREFPDPARLWTLIRKEAVESETAGYTPVDGIGAGVHRPASYHYLYILERTSLELKVRGT